MTMSDKLPVLHESGLEKLDQTFNKIEKHKNRLGYGIASILAITLEFISPQILEDIPRTVLIPIVIMIGAGIGEMLTYIITRKIQEIEDKSFIGNILEKINIKYNAMEKECVKNIKQLTTEIKGMDDDELKGLKLKSLDSWEKMKNKVNTDRIAEMEKLKILE